MLEKQKWVAYEHREEPGSSTTAMKMIMTMKMVMMKMGTTKMVMVKAMKMVIMKMTMGPQLLQSLLMST